MADNEKLDNQRLKNFKNKGRDLEVKCASRGGGAAAAAAAAPRRLRLLLRDVVSKFSPMWSSAPLLRRTGPRCAPGWSDDTLWTVPRCSCRVIRG